MKRFMLLLLFWPLLAQAAQQIAFSDAQALVAAGAIHMQYTGITGTCDVYTDTALAVSTQYIFGYISP